jgi:hypothetical protein
MRKVVNISHWSDDEKDKLAIETGMRASDIGLSRFLTDVASIAIAVSLTSGRWLDKKKVAAVVKAARQLQVLADRQ